MSAQTLGLSDSPIDFPIIEGNTRSETVQYLPFGTKTLKIHSYIPPGGTSQPILILRPKKVDSRAGVFAGYEDCAKPTNADLLVTWGAGHETGPYARSKDAPNDTGQPLALDDHGYCYFNVTHRVDPNTLPRPVTATKSYAITLQAFKEDGLKAQLPPVGELVINLDPPKLDKDPVPDPVRAIWQQQNSNESWIRFDGTQIPLYVSRWWPTQQIRYEPLAGDQAALGNLGIKYQRDVGEKKGRITVMSQGNEQVVIDGDIGTHLFDQRLFSAQVFRFLEEKYLLVRLWFMWIADQQRGEHEVPDAERFDLLFNRQFDQLVYVGIDTHWREKWGKPTAAKPWRGTIGIRADSNLPQEIWDLFQEGVGIIKDKFGYSEGRSVSGNPVNALYDELQRPSTPSRSLEAIPGVGPIILMEGSFWHKHSPSGNLQFRLSSNDVREG